MHEQIEVGYIPAGADVNKDSAFNIVNTKQCRVDLDTCLQKVKALSPQSRETSLAITKIQEAIMWLGMNLKALGTPNPYPNSRDTSNTIVDKTADGLKL